MPYRSPAQRAVTPQNRGRFPGFDVLDEVDKWDDVTAGVVLSRLALPASLSFFTPEEVAVAAPLLDLLLGQDADPRIPVLALIDERLSIDETDGWHYDDMPPDSQAWRTSLQHLDDDSQHTWDAGFAAVGRNRQAACIQAVQDAGSNGATWHGWQGKHIWSLWTRYACTAFYSHPWAWNEIGWPGPAYPRGYLNIGISARDKWETDDHDDADPIPFGQRVQRAHDTQAELLKDADHRDGAR